MRTDCQLEIAPGITDAERRAATAIYYAAFAQKLRPILGPLERAENVLASDLHLDRCIAARCDGQLVGLAGIKHAGRGFLDGSWGPYVKAYGPFSGSFRLLLLALADRGKQPGVMLMDGIAVDATMRGRGLGTQLLQAVIDFARAQGYTAVRLDVVDTNPRARQLYERVGFEAVATHRYDFLKRLGFTASTEMHYRL